MTNLIEVGIMLFALGIIYTIFQLIYDIFILWSGNLVITLKQKVLKSSRELTLLLAVISGAMFSLYLFNSGDSFLTMLFACGILVFILLSCFLHCLQS